MAYRMPKNSGVPYIRRAGQFNDKAKQIFLDNIRKTGMFPLSAEAAGVRAQTVRNHLKQHADFREDYEEAMDQFRCTIEQEVHRRAVEGWEEPVFDFKNGGIAGTIKKFSDKMLELHVKRHIAAYRDRGAAENATAGGVLVVGQVSGDDSTWEATFKDRKRE